MLDRPVLATVVIVGPAILALVGLAISPQVRGPELDLLFMLQGWMGLGLLLVACEYGVARRVHRALPRAMLAGTGFAATAAVGLGSGALSGAGIERPAAIVLLLVVLAGLWVAHGAAVLAIATAAVVETRLARGVRWVAAPVSLAAVTALAVVSIGVVEEPVALLDAGSDVNRLPRVLVAAGTLGGSLLVLLAVLGWLDRRPEVGGAVPRPAVRLRCPRCGHAQRQQEFRGCDRCGLDVRVERL